MVFPRTYTDEQLTAAVRGAESWPDVLVALGKPPHYNRTHISLVAQRLGLDTSHLRHNVSRVPSVPHPFTNEARLTHQAGASLAAAWFMERSYVVSVPLEPAAYDLIADSDTGLQRVQVKTTNAVQPGSGRYTVRLQRSFYDATAPANAHGKLRKAAYTAEEIDYFFIITAARQIYLIPIAATAGRQTLVLDAKYAEFLQPMSS